MGRRSGKGEGREGGMSVGQREKMGRGGGQGGRDGGGGGGVIHTLEEKRRRGKMKRGGWGLGDMCEREVRGGGGAEWDGWGTAREEKRGKDEGGGGGGGKVHVV